MPLIDCPDCGRAISTLAPVCIGCGRVMASDSHPTAAPYEEPPLAPYTTPERPAPGPAATAAAERVACPSCGVEGMVPLPIAHRRKVTVRAWQGAQGTAMARRLEPPEPMPEGQPLHVSAAAVIPAFAAIFIFGFVLTVAGLAVAALVAKVIEARRNTWAVRWNRDELPRRLAAWDRSRVCLECGRIVDPAETLVFPSRVGE
jgi:hypothetical protein